MARTDSQTGTPVTLVVTPQQTTPGTTVPPPAPAPHHHLPFTGVDLVPALAVAALLVAAGSVLTAVRRPLLAR
jgi:hypothetical protein